MWAGFFWGRRNYHIATGMHIVRELLYTIIYEILYGIIIVTINAVILQLSFRWKIMSIELQGKRGKREFEFDINRRGERLSRAKQHRFQVLSSFELTCEL